MSSIFYDRLQIYKLKLVTTNSIKKVITNVMSIKLGLDLKGIR